MDIPIMEPYKVLIRVDDKNRIVEINSSAFVGDTPVWTEIDQGYGDKYHHAQGNYLPAPLWDDRGIPRYAYVPDAAEGEPKWRERTQAEMDADYVPPVPLDTVTMDDVIEYMTDIDLRLTMQEMGLI